MKRLAGLIVRSRFVVFIMFAAATVFCFLSLGRVRVNSDLSAFLPEDTMTRRAISAMQDEFSELASAQVMVCGVSFDEANALSESFAAIDGVASVGFDNGPDHFVDGKALFSVSFDGAGSDARVISAMDAIRRLAADRENYVSTKVGADLVGRLAGEMAGVIAISAAVIVVVLLLTSRSFLEVPVFIVVFTEAALLNMGTNYWLGEISTITNSVAVILQLALAIDYAIIFAHRFQDEAHGNADRREALVAALAGSIREIFSSALTTVSGLAALTLMQFGLGRDLGLVLAKGIVCSMLTVFLLMPALISLFPGLLRRTEHRRLLPDVSGWGRFLTRRGLLFVVIFALILPFAVVFSGRVEYGFTDSAIDELIPTPAREASEKINSVFSPDTALALLVPAGDPDAERAVIDDVKRLDGVKSVTGLAGIELAAGIRLTDRFSPAQLPTILSAYRERAVDLFKLYALETGDEEGLKDPEHFSVPIYKILCFLLDKTESGAVSLSESQSELVTRYAAPLKRAVSQLQGEKLSRIVITSSLPVQGEKSEALADSIIAAASARYSGEVFLAGDVTSARDLKASYSYDSTLISLLSALFVFVILLFTFGSPVAAAILVFVIQGSIWINFAFTYLGSNHPCFVTYMIVSAIQMGATIDYAIVLMTRYLANRKVTDAKSAAVRAVSESFATVITSGSIMTAAGLVIAFRVSDVYVGHIGLAVGRGALISVILVLTVLPQLIVLFDGAISKTRFFKKDRQNPEAPADARLPE